MKKKLNNKYLDPVSAYLEHENISYEKLVEFIKSMGQKAKKPFKDALTDIGKTILMVKSQNIMMIFIILETKHILI